MYRACDDCGVVCANRNDYARYPKTERGKAICYRCANERSKRYHAERDKKPDYEAAIYCLIDPRNGEKFYVGSTRCKLKARLIQHMTQAGATVEGWRSHKDVLLYELRESGIKPEIELLETCTFGEIRQRESYWIKELLDHNCPLTNSVNTLKDAHLKVHKRRNYGILQQ